NNILDQLQYSITWHSIPQKSDGGYSLELFYPNQFCNQKKSWGTSNHASGGTPGNKNSIWNLAADNDKPLIASVIALSEWEISVVFNKTIDLTTMSSINNYSLKPGTSIANAEISDNKEEVVLLLNNPLIKGIKYTLNISTLKDCSGNISANVEAEFEIPSESQVGELLFNELLFNPRTGGVDYIELFNNSNKLLSTNEIFINNRIKDERWVNINVKTVMPAFSYLVLTSDPLNIIENYPLHDSSKIQKASMVSMDDDKGSLRLGIFKNGEITILDSVHYSDEWHNPLISDKSGVSLEKIFTSLSSNESRNWTSASSTFNYGSPGLKNSQFVDTNNVYHKEKPYTIESIVVSPNDDGKNDQLTIHLNLKKDGYKNRLRIFDLSGNEIADLNSVIVGTFDIIRWNGINKDNELAATGNYIAVISFVHPDGESIEHKERFVLDN
ncbi:MAG: hypothetical protein HOP11_08915, partial [Saprospiraceae bacterium]|nr:hypothetical protein [Saprospiraceae bacterium]